MNISLGAASHVVKIVNVDSCTTPTTAHLDIDVNLVVKQPALVKNICAHAQPFALLCTDLGLASFMMASNSKVLEFLTKKISSPHVSFITSALPRSLSSTWAPTNRLGNLPAYRFQMTLSLNPHDTGEVQFGAGSETPSSLSRRTRMLFVGLWDPRSIDTITALDTLSLDDPTAVSPYIQNIVLAQDAQFAKPYLGPAALDSNGNWVRTDYPSNTSEARLYAKTVLNRKIKYKEDLFKKFDKNLFQLSSTVIPTGKIVAATVPEIVREYTHQHKNYFSPLYGAKSTNNTLPIVFAFNQIQYLRDNGAGLSSFLKNDGSLTAAFTLQSARIFRKRKTSKYGFHALTQNVPAQDFDCHEEIISDNPRTVNLLGGTGVLTFCAEDKHEKEIIKGTYAYGVELVYLDRSRELVKNLLTNETVGLIPLTTKLSLLHKEMLQPWHYDNESASFIDSYLNSLRKTRYKDKLWITAIEAYVHARGAFLSSAEGARSAAADAATIYNNTNPYDNGPAGIYRLWKLLNSLKLQIQRLFPSDERYYSNQGPSKKGTRDSKLVAPLPRLVTKHYFNEYFEEQDYISNGYGYIPTTRTGPPNYSPLRLVPYSLLTSILDEQRVVTQTATGTPLNAGVFLSPAEFTMNDHTYSLAVTPDAPNTDGSSGFKTNSVVASTLALASLLGYTNKDYSSFNIPDSLPNGPSGEEMKVLNNNIKLLEAKNCTVRIKEGGKESLFSAAAVPKKGQQKSTDDYEDASIKMSPSSPFIVNDPSTVALVDFVASAANNNEQHAVLKRLISLDADILYYLTQTDYFSEVNDAQLPVRNLTDAHVFKNKGTTLQEYSEMAAARNTPQASASRSIMAQKLLGREGSEPLIPAQYMEYVNALKGSISAKDIVNFSLKYGLVMGVQYLAGFEKGTLMGAPIWVNLARTQLSAFASKGANLLCRFRPPTSAFSEFRGIKAAIFDEIFVLTSNRSLGDNGYTLANPTISSILPDTFMTTVQSVEETSDEADELMFTTIIGSQRIRGGVSTSRSLNKSLQSLYTKGGDWSLSAGSGDYYTGDYHIHIKANGEAAAMVGAVHTGAPHKTLMPISERAQNQLASAAAAANVETTALASTTDAPPSLTTGGTGGSGGPTGNY